MAQLVEQLQRSVDKSLTNSSTFLEHRSGNATLQKQQLKISGMGANSKAVASNTRDPRFESHRRQKLLCKIHLPIGKEVDKQPTTVLFLSAADS